MRCLGQIVGWSAVALLALVAPSCSHKDETTNWQKFSVLLDTVDEMALRRVMHAVYPKFRDGVYHKIRTAAEQVHSENPMMASRLVHIAKRQSVNDTTSTTFTTTTTESETPSDTTVLPPTSTFDTITTTSPPPTTTPEQTIPPQTTNSQDEAVNSAISSVLSNDITASSVPPPTTVFLEPSIPPSASAIRTESQGVVYSVSGGVLTLTSTAVYVSFTPVTSTRYYYVTGSSGQIETRTSLVVVNAPQTEGAAAEPPTTATSSPRPVGSGMKMATFNMAGLIAATLGVLML